MAQRDAWLVDFEDAKSCANEVFLLISDRDNADGDLAQAAAARLSASARRKWNTLTVRLERLEATLTSVSASEKEMERRRMILQRLREQSKDLGERLARKRPPAGQEMQEASSSRGETAETASLDEHGLLQLQRDLLRDQDEQLDGLSRVVTSTKHVAVAIHDELELQHRLLDDLDDEVEHTGARMRVAQSRLKKLIRKSNECKMTCLLFWVVVLLFSVLLIVLRVTSSGIFG